MVLFLAATGCEKPRERACRSLVLQARNAEAARTAATPDARIAAYRAQSAARWLRSNAVDDTELEAFAAGLADSLDRLADARLRLAKASDALGATDATDLLARAERVSAYVSATDRVFQTGLKPCPWDEPNGLIEDPRCSPYHARELCPPFDASLTFAQHAERCLRIAETLPELAAVRSDAVELASTVRAHASWAKTLPARSAKETVDLARGLSTTFADRGRADADITSAVRALEGKCAP
jgi:hypothetical protein